MIILVVDDSESFCQEIRALNLPDVYVAECLSVNAGMEAVRKTQPDVLFVDDKLCCGGEGLAIARGARELNPNIDLVSTTGGSWSKGYYDLGCFSCQKEDVRETLPRILAGEDPWRHCRGK
jgi:DNA-binding NtrC family response regulator